jgi:hypothetical protein
MTTLQESEELAMTTFYKVFERFTDELEDEELNAIAPLLTKAVWQHELIKMIQNEFDYRMDMHEDNNM